MRNILFASFTILFGFMFFSCKTSTTTKDACGDNFIDYGEECDGQNLGGSTCQNSGYYSGELSCNENCTLNYNNCAKEGSCGDSVVQSNYGEICDGQNVVGETCETQGYLAGTLKCSSNCLSFDFSECGGTCGNGIIQESEECDSENLNGKDCQSFGYYGGNLLCSNCLFDISDCAASGYCGDGIIQPIEQCDGTNFSTNCADYGDFQYEDIISSCNSDCTIDTSICKLSWIQISSGNYHTCGIKSNGTLWCWGYNNKGQLGIGNTTDASTPRQVEDATTWWQVSAGGSHTCGIKSNGTLWCWGGNNYGQLGTGSTDEYSTPQQIGQDSWKQITTGLYHTCGIKTNDTLWCWGYNHYGQLGIGNTDTYFTTPQQLANTTDFVQIEAGYYHTCGIRSNGTLWCWGYNHYGQLGTGNISDATTPQQIGTLNWAQVLAGKNYTCGIASNSTNYLWCWGYNNHGQLGTDDTTEYHSPQSISSSWKQISFVSYHTCGIKQDGTLWCWGYNVNGRLGIGVFDNSDYKMPQQVGDATDWEQISLGNDHSCAINSENKLYCWGRNNYGQLGLGSNDSTNLPVYLIF